MTWLREHAILAFGLFGALLSGVSAAIFRLNRLYAYAWLMVIVFAGGYLLGASLWLAVVLMGAMMLLCGTILLFRFLQKYPAETLK